MTTRVYNNWDQPPNYYDFFPQDTIFPGDGGFFWDFGDWDYMFTDLAMTTKVTAAGQAVAAVKDKGPNGFDLFQGTGGARPISAVVGGFKTLDFSLGQIMETNTVGMALASHKGYAVFETDSTANFMRLISTSSAGANDTGTTDSIAIHSGDNTAHFGVRARSAAYDTKVGGAGNSPIGLYEYDLVGTVASIYYNAVAGTGDASAGGLTAFSGGKIICGTMAAANVATTTGQFDGRITAILHCGTIPNGSMNTKVKNWLNANRY